MGGASSVPPRLERRVSQIEREWAAHGLDVLELVSSMTYVAVFFNQLVKIRARRATRLWRRATRAVWLARALDARRLQLVRETFGTLRKYSPYAGVGFQVLGTKRHFTLTSRGLCWSRAPVYNENVRLTSTIKGIPFWRMSRIAITHPRTSTGFLINVYCAEGGAFVGTDMITYKFRGSRDDVLMWTSALAIMAMPYSLGPRVTHAENHQRPAPSRPTWVDRPRMLALRAAHSLSPSRLQARVAVEARPLSEAQAQERAAARGRATTTRLA
ncbi:hypothetical protein KFE25_006227 [Diacronema lutheri]|uniref:Uncharacterized protein n=1 Tax=Diacronema lutheri TaxID=2081491 RepID=A0A8J5XWH1_DIALT|nr:hypothetical protein KFE25_006227 [Diacronema lutheri]